MFCDLLLSLNGKTKQQNEKTCTNCNWVYQNKNTHYNLIKSFLNLPLGKQPRSQILSPTLRDG